MYESITRHTAIAVLRQTLRDLWAGNAMEWAAALAFYVVLSLFPLLLAGAAAASLVVDPAVVTARLSALAEGVLPPGVIDVEALVAAAVAARRQVGIGGVILWLLAGRRLLGALVTALDWVSDVDERQESPKRRTLVELVLLAGIGGLLLLALSARWLLGLVWDTVWGNGSRAPVAWAVAAAVHTLALVVTFYALYTVVPYGKRHRRAAFLGAVTATALVLLVRVIFRLGLDRLWDSFALLYGPLALAALLLTWAWLLGLIILFGGSLASHMAVMGIEGKSAEVAERRHVPHKDGA